VKQALKLYHSGDHTLHEIESLTGIKPTTLYRKLAQEKRSKEP